MNEKGWFDEYLKDEIFVEIIKRIKTESFEQVEWEYINDYEEFSEKVKRFEQVFIEEGIEIGGNRKTINIAMKGIKAGLSNEILQSITELTDDQINELRNEHAPDLL